MAHNSAHVSPTASALQPLTVSVKQLARILNIGTTKAWRLVKDGEVQVVRIGGRTLVVRESIQAMIARHIAAAQTPAPKAAA